MKVTFLLVVLASAVGERLTECRAESNDQKRLSCYDKIRLSTPASSVIGEETGPDQVVSVWDTQLLLATDNVKRNLVKLLIHYENHSEQKVVGVLVKAKIKNAFGKTVYSQLIEDEVVLAPKSKDRRDTWWQFVDNPYINDEPYDKMWQMAKNGNGTVETELLKVILQGGIVLERKPKKRQKPK